MFRRKRIFGLFSFLRNEWTPKKYFGKKWSSTEARVGRLWVGEKAENVAPVPGKCKYLGNENCFPRRVDGKNMCDVGGRKRRKSSRGGMRSRRFLGARLSVGKSENTRVPIRGRDCVMMTSRKDEDSRRSSWALGSESVNDFSREVLAVAYSMNIYANTALWLGEYVRCFYEAIFSHIL